MELGAYVRCVRQELAAAAEAGGDDARALAERLTAPLESGLRLALLDALSDAADEITRDLAPGSVHLRLRGREPSFVVTAAEQPAAAGQPAPVSATAPAADDSATARINFRLGEQLKARIETAAEEAGLSVNAWLTRAASAALDAAPAARRAPQGADHFSGWVR